ncbi:MAG: SagB/ThcOx family dehydrogenase [Dehalococcoidia bacterium]
MKEAITKLPPPQLQGDVSLEEAIARRRSVRRYRRDSLSLAELGQILWSAQGITGHRALRAAPSAGATYPLEILVLAGQQCVAGLDSGIYLYLVNSHSLKLHKSGDFRIDLARAALGQEFIAQAPVAIAICAVYARTCNAYGRRGERYVHIEVGHVAENMHLQATALGLASVEVGAFEDEQVRKVLSVEEQVKPLYIMPVGKAESRNESR